MKKLIFVSLIIFLVPIAAHSQTYRLLCSWAGGNFGQGLNQPTRTAVQASNQVARALEVDYISIYQGGVLNASATVLNNEPVIVYNSNFMNAMFRSGSQWAPKSIIAHEYGHHLNYDTTYYGQFKHPWTKELQSDFVSGLAMARMGATLEEATRALIIQFSSFGSQSHPDTPRRLDAVSQGWYRGRT